ncbi:TonB-dependent receptor [Chitinophaga horti]|uniref:TonB-dependent receptor n=1 Tax=Chitinophaga horti TaxID=2920382 RepID=A0ABY6J722_9BACT|nr:TonB-dependent receptor family protein [Chitinophaga horti]UYQ93954.1 TonB-dependent receptor [Chitinophaga horti]
MPRFFLLVILSLFLHLQGYTQSKVSWTGKVVDSTTKEILELATVAVNDAKDSTLFTYTLTDHKGVFKLESLPKGQTFVFLVSYTGYKQYRKVMKTGDASADLGTIILAPSSRALGEVVVEGEKPPITIKNDTLEFNASSFRTKPNAVVEDLLKKLPGVEVEADGSIKVNGKKVSRVLVDGKEFFGNDPKIATKNLPKEIVDKIQVVDTKSKVQQLTGQKTDGEDKTINITLKEDKKKGLFGRITAGAGTQHRYDVNTLLNRFSPKQQLSFLASSNNLNNTGFSIEDLMGLQGGKRSGGSSVSINTSTSGSASVNVNGLNVGGVGGDGVRNIAMAGVNYNDEWSKSLQVGGSYFYNYADTRTESSSRRQFTNTENANTLDETRSRRSYANNDRLNMTFTYSIDSFTTLILTPNLDRTYGSGLSLSRSSTHKSDGSLANSSDMQNRSINDVLNFNNNISLVKILNRKGRNLSVELGQTYSNNNNDQYLESENFFRYPDRDSTGISNQHTRSTGNNQGYTANVTYTEPLSETWKMIVAYRFSYGLNRSDRQTYNLDENTGKFDNLDSAFSDKFRNINIQQRPQLSFDYSGEKFNATIGGGMQYNTLKNYSYTRNDSITQRQQTFTPTTRFSYRFSPRLMINFGYNFYSRQPTINELQPVRDNTNRLFVNLGNPDLKTAFTHNFSTGMTAFSPAKGFNYGLNLGISPTSNAIVMQTTYDSAFVQYARPVNVGGTYSSSMWAYASKSIRKKDYSLRINGSLNASVNKSVSFSSQPGKPILRNETTTINPGASLNVSYTYKEVLDFSPGYRINYRKTDYSISNLQSGDALVHGVTLYSALFWPAKFVWENDLNYTYNTNMAPGYRKDVTLWNMSVSRMFLKNDRGTLKVSVYDLLNQNIAARRNITQDYIEDSQVMIVQQYFMLSFTYNISSFGGVAPARKAGKGGRNMRF